MTGVVNAYEGAGYVQNAPPGMRKKTSTQSIKETHRKVMGAHVKIGEMALNAADFERTMHLPIGRRLACDETGEFDAEAPRLRYNPDQHNFYPRHVHSTVTDGEYIEVHNEVEHMEVLRSRKWSDKPLEKRRRFVLTPEDQMQNLKGQVEAERAARLFMEKEFEARMVGMDAPKTPADSGIDSIHLLQLEHERDERKKLEAKFDALMASLSRSTQPNESVQVTDESETEEEAEEDGEDEESTAAVKSSAAAARTRLRSRKS